MPGAERASWQSTPMKELLSSPVPLQRLQDWEQEEEEGEGEEEVINLAGTVRELAAQLALLRREMSEQRTEVVARLERLDSRLGERPDQSGLMEEDCTSFQYRPGSSSSEDSDTPDRSRGLEAFLQEQRGLTRRLQLDREALLAQNET